jgi:hypothetical protein
MNAEPESQNYRALSVNFSWIAGEGDRTLGLPPKGSEELNVLQLHSQRRVIDKPEGSLPFSYCFPE